MNETPTAPPPCFGALEKVFPMGAEGLRETPPACMPCPCRVACLRAAMADGGGIVVRQEIVDRAYASGVVGFFERWARKKALCAQQRPKGKK